MTHRTIRESLNFVFLHKLRAERELIALRLPLRVENFAARAHEFFRAAMALQAPLHGERAFAPRHRHLAHRAMTRNAAHAFLHVYAVIEIGEVGQVIHAHPFDGFVLAPTRAHGFEHFRGVVNLGMAGHARFGGRNAGKIAFLHGSVAIAAIKPELRDVVAMAEGHRLLEHDVRARHVRRAFERAESPEQQADKKDAAKDADFGKSVGAGMKDLRHARLWFEEW